MVYPDLNNRMPFHKNLETNDPQGTLQRHFHVLKICLRGGVHYFWNLAALQKLAHRLNVTKGFDKMNICISRFGIRIGWRKYLIECTPFVYVSLWMCPGSVTYGQFPPDIWGHIHAPHIIVMWWPISKDPSWVWSLISCWSLVLLLVLIGMYWLQITSPFMLFAMMGPSRPVCSFMLAGKLEC